MNSISIVIVTYNSGNEISNCISSIISTFNDLPSQIIITDNHSTDNTLSIIQKIDHPNILLITNDKNLGYTKAINQCLKHVTSKFVLFLNPDTVIKTDSFTTLLEELNEDETLGVIAPQLKFPNGNIQKSCRRFPRRRDVFYESFGMTKLFKNSKEFNYWKMGDFDHNKNNFVDQPAGAALLTKKNIIEEIGMLDERFPMFFSDVDYCRRIRDAGYKIKFSINSYLIHAGGASVLHYRTKMITSSHLSFYKFFQKYNIGLVNSILNIITGLFLLFLIPIRILFAKFLPKSIRLNRHTL